MNLWTRLRRPILALVETVIVMAGSSAAAQPTSTASAFRLPRLFQDGMVLQRDTPVPVWGWAVAGSNVTVTLDGRTQRTVADAAGSWSVDLEPMEAGGPHTMTVEASGDRIVLRDLLVGDVWVASGQSNMEWPLSQVTDAAAAVAAARDPMLREFAVPHSWSETPESDLAGGSWSPADPEHAGSFSAVAYFFARDLRASTGVPIGVIHTSWGGANVETWMSRSAHGFDDAEWNALIQRQRDSEAAMRESLRTRLGGLPTTDAGLANGRAVWADPALDDSDWAAIPVPSLWEQAGYEGLDGSAWYRTTFDVDAEETRHVVRLSLGKIDDDDVAWVNGIEIGRTVGYAKPRTYTVPVSALRPGRNVLALRVADGGGGGGAYGEATEFHVDVAGQRRSLAGEWKFKVGSVSFQADGQRINKIPAFLYNQMIHPLLRQPIRGAIWYQGESNANDDAQAAAYQSLFAELIRSWRREWTDAAGEFPFLWVQLPNFGAVDSLPPARAAWATLRESQTAALELPTTGQVVAIDVGDPDDIHPRDKEPVGRRLALVARKVAYREPVIASGPIYRSHKARSSRIIIEFEDVGTGLVSRGPEGRIREFAIAGADQRFRWAEAQIEGSTVVVWHPDVPNPVAVRYAWSNSPAHPDLYNAEGLPARPFRTDSW